MTAKDQYPEYTSEVLANTMELSLDQAADLLALAAETVSDPEQNDTFGYFQGLVANLLNRTIG